MNYVPVIAGILVVSEEELERMHEAHELERLRIDTLTSSLCATKNRLREKRAVNDAAQCAYHEALLCLAEDEDDKFEDAKAKSEKLERIEAEFIAASPIFQNALLRVGWELKQAEKAGLNLR